MRIDWKERIHGAEMIHVRDTLRRVCGHRFQVNFFEACFGEAAHGLFQALLDRQWIEPDPDKTGRFRLTKEGGQMAAAKAVPRISRAKADHLMSGLLLRVEKVNGMNTFPHRIDEIRIFGSYLEPETEDLGDIDIAISIVPRQPNNDRDILRHAETLEVFTDCVYDAEQLCRDELKKLLRARSPYLSLTDFYILERIRAPSKCFFKFGGSGGRGAWNRGNLQRQ